MNKKIYFFVAFALALLLGCVTQKSKLLAEYEASGKADNFFVVDCLLPAQVRKLGQLATYLTARRPIKTTAGDCEIRGGEYVAYDRASFATSLKVWLPKAQGGDAEAQAYVGEIYEKGLGLEPDYQLAVQWYRKAAEQGNTRAQINLGFLYEKGLGVEKDLSLAMAWYKKSSGLDKTNIPYAATIESSSQDDQLRDEIIFLKTELNNSRNETKTLSKQLASTQQQIVQDKQQLISARSQLNQTEKQLKTAAARADSAEITRLEKVINSKEREISQQRQNIALLEEQYRSEVQGLTVSLDATEKRAKQIAADLKTQQSSENEAQLKLLQAQAEMANTEKRLINLKSESLHKLDKVTAAQLHQDNQTQQNLDRKELELQSIKDQLHAQTLEKSQQQAVIVRLELEKKVFKGNVAKLQNLLQSHEVSAEQVKQYKDELQTQKQSVIQATDQMQDTQAKLALTEQQLTELELISGQEVKALIADIAHLEKQLASSSSQKTKSQQRIEQQLLEGEKKWHQQQNLILKLESEKLQYEDKIKQLQANAEIQTTSNKPHIEIIDPPFVLVRGKPTVTLRSVVKHRDIIGKVTSPKGLLSLLVNDQKNAVDGAGLFHTSVNLVGAQTPVTVVAIDNRGKRSQLEFMLSLEQALESTGQVADIDKNKPIDEPWKLLDYGKYYALIIGNNKYQKVPSLNTPITDAREVEKILKAKYGFKTTLLLNGTRYQILSALNKFRGELSEKDNLLIYYAGHGELDKVNMRGHWLPVDADADNTANWISTIAITDILNMMSVKHIMVISDSCYSGAMTRSSLARLEAGVSSGKKSEWLKAMLKAKSRTVLTSGGLKPVMDGGGGRHSVFARALIKALKNNATLLEGQALYRQVSIGIIAIAAGYGIEQVPEYAPIRHAGHESGEFFFVPKS